MLYGKINLKSAEITRRKETVVHLGGEVYFCYGPNAISCVLENDRYFVYHRGIPALDPKSLNALIQKFDLEKDKRVFRLNKGCSLVLIHDKKTRSLRIYRDAWGTVPVFYFKNADLISDSIDTIMSQVGNPQLNKNAVGEYLASSYVVGEQTLYEKLFSLRPMSMLEKIGTQVRILPNHRYPEIDHKISEAELAHRLEECIDRSTRGISSAIRNSGQIFVSLSGGTDSSLLISKMAEHYGNNDFKCGVVEYVNWHRNDTPYYSYVAKKYALNGNIEQIDNESYAESLLDLTRKGMYAYHTFAPSFHRLLRSTVKMYPKIKFHVNGTGPDEAVIGFEKVSIAAMREFDKTKRSQWAEKLFSEVDYFYTPKEKIAPLLAGSKKQDILERRMSLASDIAQASDSFSEFQRRYAMQTITDHHIKMLYHISLLSGLDTIYPYCTQELFDLLFGVPYYLLNTEKSYKFVFKKILGKYFSQEFVFRPKIGFHAPSRTYFKSEVGLGKIIKELDVDSIKKIGKPKKIKNEINNRLYRDDAPLDYLLWTLTNIMILNQAMGKKTAGE